MAACLLSIPKPETDQLSDFDIAKGLHVAEHRLARRVLFSLFAAAIVGCCVFIGLRQTPMAFADDGITGASVEAVSGATTQADAEDAKQEPAVDAVGGASADSEKETKLPPEDPFYDVLGNVDGIEGYVIKYTNKLYRGGTLKDSTALKYLRRQGITTIVSITPDEKERRLCQIYGMKLVELPFEKKKTIPENTLSVFLTETRMAEGGVYVHCHGGAHRAGILGAAYRIHLNNWPAEKAIVEFSKLGGDLTEDNRMVQSILSPVSDSNTTVKED